MPDPARTGRIRGSFLARNHLPAASRGGYGPFCRGLAPPPSGEWIRPVRKIRLALITLVIISAPSTAGADVCARAKLKALGKAESGLLACRAVAAKSDRSDFSACQRRVMAKFSAALTRAGACGGDQTRCADIVESCDSAMAAFLTDAFPSR